jgi:hypothetical protein
VFYFWASESHFLMSSETPESPCSTVRGTGKKRQAACLTYFISRAMNAIKDSIDNQ